MSDEFEIVLEGNTGTVAVGGSDVSRMVSGGTLSFAAGRVPVLALDLVAIRGGVVGKAETRLYVCGEEFGVGDVRELRAAGLDHMADRLQRALGVPLEDA